MSAETNEKVEIPEYVSPEKAARMALKFLSVAQISVAKASEEVLKASALLARFQ